MCWAVLLVLCCGAPARAHDVVLQLKWRHQFQFAGYYMAQELGYYAEAGLNVDIREYAPGHDPLTMLAEGRAQFATTGTEALLAYLGGTPVVALAAVFQHSPNAILATEASDIRTPHDLVGKRVMLGNPVNPELLAMLRNEGVGLDQMTLPPTDWDISRLLDGDFDATAVYTTSGPFYLEERGVPYTLLRPATYGADFYGDMLCTTREMIRTQPQAVRDFRRASLRGWEYALEHVDETIAVIQDRYPNDKTLGHLRFEAAAIIDLVKPQLVRVGHMNPGRWRHIAKTYAELGLTEPDGDLRGFLYDPDASGLPMWLQKALLWVGAFVTVAVLLAVLLVLFNLRLRRSVHARTRELAREMEERKQVEQALRRSEGLMRAVLGNFPDGAVILFDEDMRYLLADGQGLADIGLDKTQLLGRTIHEILPDDVCRVLEPHFRATLDGEYRQFETDFAGRVYECRTVPIRAEAEDGALDGADNGRTGLVIVQNITRRKRGERELRKLSRVIEQTPVSVIITDRSGAIEYVNPQFEKITGYTAAEVLGKRPNLLKSGMHEQELYEEMWRTIKNGGTWRGELCSRAKDGSLFWESASILPITDDDGSIRFYVSVKEDITERRQAQQALAKSEQTLRTVSEASQDAIIMIDSSGAVTFWNPAAELLFGHTAAEAVGRNIHDLILLPDDRPNADEGLRRFAATGTGKVLDSLLEGTALHKDGRTIPVEVSVSGVRMEGQWHAVGTVRDMTERKAAEERLQRLARTDELTGLCNRRHFMERTTDELERAKRYDKPMALLMLDVDHFKVVNDTHGHAVGDGVLRQVADVATRQLRSVDVMGRIGGEEFAVLLPETGAEGAMEVAERLRRAVAAMHIETDEGPLNVTISIGAAARTTAGADVDVDTLLKRADDAMYEAKRAGRDRVRQAPA